MKPPPLTEPRTPLHRHRASASHEGARGVTVRRCLCGAERHDRPDRRGRWGFPLSPDVAPLARRLGAATLLVEHWIRRGSSTGRAWYSLRGGTRTLGKADSVAEWVSANGVAPADALAAVAGHLRRRVVEWRDRLAALPVVTRTADDVLRLAELRRLLGTAPVE